MDNWETEKKGGGKIKKKKVEKGNMMRRGRTGEKTVRKGVEQGEKRVETGEKKGRKENENK